MIIRTDISGSVCVVGLGGDHYIDVAKDVRKPEHVHIEFVRNGQVYQREMTLFRDAPSSIIRWVKRGVHA